MSTFFCTSFCFSAAFPTTFLPGRWPLALLLFSAFFAGCINIVVRKVTFYPSARPYWRWKSGWILVVLWRNQRVNGWLVTIGEFKSQLLGGGGGSGCRVSSRDLNWINTAHQVDSPYISTLCHFTSKSKSFGQNEILKFLRKIFEVSANSDLQGGGEPSFWTRDNRT